MVGGEGGGLLLDPIVAAKGADPVESWVAAEPGELALGVVAMALLGGGDGLLRRQRVPREDWRGPGA